jgi:PhoPQ-activated pathogenicity-related protein
LDVGLVENMDDPNVIDNFAMMDPFSFQPQLQKIPKLTVTSSDDEFMMMDWSNIWDKEVDELGPYGEMHLMIAPNSDHSPLLLFTGGGTSAV